MTIQNKVQLITYPDSLGHNLPELHYVLRKYLKEAVGGVHILPFYPSSGDRGFAPLTYDEVDPNFGTWKDIEKIGIEDSPENRLILTWTDNQSRAKAFINLDNYNTKITYYDPEKDSDCEFIV